MKRIVFTIIAVVMANISITAQNDEHNRVLEELKQYNSEKPTTNLMTSITNLVENMVSTTTFR